MQKEYIEKIPAQEIKHILTVCENEDCLSVIKDNGKFLSGHYQIGDGKKLLDFCSEKCSKSIKG